MRRRGTKEFIVVLFLGIALFPVFAFNALGTADASFFENWQLDSDALVTTAISSAPLESENSLYGLYVPAPSTSDEIGSSTSAPVATEEVPYVSSLGLQGWFARGASYFGFSDLHRLQLLNAALFAFVFSTFIVLAARITNVAFSVATAVVAIGSPWLVTAAHSPFWVTWSWYLPIVFTLGYLLARRSWLRIAYASAAVLAFAFRFGSGYEFLTNFALFAASMPILAKIFSKESSGIRNWRSTLVESVRCFAFAVGGFLIAFTAHAILRGSGNALAGAVDIFKMDVLRRTYGGSGEFSDPLIQASLQASPLKVLWTYIFDWRTDFFSVGYGSPFTITFGPESPWALLAGSAGIALILWIKGNSNWRAFAQLLGVGAAVSLCWYILGKGHSFIHTHVNFVLWYLMLAPVIVFITFNGVFIMFRDVTSRRRTQTLLQ